MFDEMEWQSRPIMYKEEPSEEIKWEIIRNHRDMLISSAQNLLDRHRREQDMIALGTGIEKTTLNDDQILEVYLYMQQLADLPQKYTNADDVIFPRLNK